MSGSRSTRASTLFAHLQRLPVAFYDHRHTSELTSRLTNDVALLQESLLNDVLPIAFDPLCLVGCVAIAALMDWRLMLVCVVVPAALLATHMLW